MTENGEVAEDSAPLRMLLAVVLAVIVVAGSVDLVLDAPDRWLTPHVVFELAMIAGALGLATFLWWGWWRTRRDVRALARRLAEGQVEREAWRASAERALAGFGEAIATQFRAWQLTPTEQEIALRLLRGESHKAIAIDTSRSERTVRQHAGVVYRKAGVGSRAELAAFFLGGITIP